MIKNLPTSQAWRRLYLAAIVSVAGNQLTRIVLFVKVQMLGGEIAGLTTIALVQALPALFIAPIAGTMAQRWNKRNFLIASDLVRSFLLVAIAWSNSLNVLFVLATLTAVCSAVFDPVEADLEVDYLPKQDIQLANAWRTGTMQFLTIAGPSIAAAMLIFLSVNIILVLDAATYLLSAILLFGLPKGVNSTNPETRQAWTTDLREGAVFVARASQLRGLFVASAVVFLIMGMQGPLFFTFADDRLGEGGEAFGILMTALGLGSLGGAFFMARSEEQIKKPLNLLSLVLALDAGALYAFTFGESLIACSLWMMVMGAISAFFSIVVRTYLQTEPPEHMRSRVLGWFWAMYGPLNVASLAFAMWLSFYIGAIEILQGAAIAELLAAVALAASLWSNMTKIK